MAEQYDLQQFLGFGFEIRQQAQGFDAETIWDIAAIAAFFALSNRIANFSGMMPNEEFYAMGRAPSQASRPAR